MSLLLAEDSLDDVLNGVFDFLIRAGEPVATSRGSTLETRGARLELRNPRARVSRSAAMGHFFSALAETTWYLTGRPEHDHVEFYLPDYRARIGSGAGAYGPRLFGVGAGGQIRRVVAQIRESPTTRQAVVQLFDLVDLSGDPRDVPCTCTLQFLLRSGRVDTVVYMRSNDAAVGLPHDVFAFTFIQELVARAVDADVGTYIHTVGSLHLYEADRAKVDAYMREGVQAIDQMPEMPSGSPWNDVDLLLQDERTLRHGNSVLLPTASSPYWQALTQTLIGYHAFRRRDSSSLSATRRLLAGSFYDLYLQERHFRLEGTLPDA